MGCFAGESYLNEPEDSSMMERILIVRRFGSCVNEVHTVLKLFLNSITERACLLLFSPNQPERGQWMSNPMVAICLRACGISRALSPPKGLSPPCMFAIVVIGMINTDKE